MYEGCDSFGECHSKTFVSFPWLPVWMTQVRVEAGFSKHCLPVPLSPPPLCSCHSDPLSKPCCSSDLTSSTISCLLLEPCCFYTSTNDTLVQYHCAEASFHLAHMFYSTVFHFLLEVESVRG